MFKSAEVQVDLARGEKERAVLDDWLAWGIVDRRVIAGLQFNVAAAIKDKRREEDGRWTIIPLESVTEATACRLSCTTKVRKNHASGGYECFAASENNQGLNHKTKAPVELIVAAALNHIVGIQDYHRGGFRDALSDHGLPIEVEEHLLRMCDGGVVEFNFFGGSPNELEGLFIAIRELKTAGHVVNLTDTGVRMDDPEFVKGLCESGVDRMSISMDYLTPEAIKELDSIPMEELAERTNSTLGIYGQQKKAMAAIYTLRLYRDRDKYPGFPPVSVNFAFFEGCIDRVIEVVDLLGDLYGVRVNPYPNQSAHERRFPGDPERGKPTFTEPEKIAKFEVVIDEIIRRHREFDLDHLVPRFHYYLALKAIFNAYRDDPKTLTERLSGYEVWQCYQPEAGRYGQESAAYPGMKFPEDREGKKYGGGVRACSWNSTIHDIHQTEKMWAESPEEARVNVVRWMTTGMGEAARKMGDLVCQGCLMPRLMFDILNVIAGMKDPRVKREFISLCQREIGWPRSGNKILIGLENRVAV